MVLFSPFNLNKAKSRHHGRSPRRCHACYGIDKTRSDINTVAGVQSNYVAWPASIPASHAVLCWRPCIQPASGIRVLVFIFELSANLGLFTSTGSETLPSTLRSTHHSSLIRAFGQGASPGSLKPLRLKQDPLSAIKKPQYGTGNEWMLTCTQY